MVNIGVGDRVFVEGYGSGIVKYVGKLESEYYSRDLYVGIKLDNSHPERHDGIVCGKRYFVCPFGQGLMTKLHNVTLIKKFYVRKSKVPTKIAIDRQKRKEIELKEKLRDSLDVNPHRVSESPLPERRNCALGVLQ